MSNQAGVQMEKWTERSTDETADRGTDRQTDEQMDRCIYRERDKRDRQTDGWMEEQFYRQMDIWCYKQINRYICLSAYRLTFKHKNLGLDRQVNRLINEQMDI